jgi:hypothetical protein
VGRVGFDRRCTLHTRLAAVERQCAAVRVLVRGYMKGETVKGTRRILLLVFICTRIASWVTKGPRLPLSATIYRIRVRGRVPHCTCGVLCRYEHLLWHINFTTSPPLTFHTKNLPKAPSPSPSTFCSFPPQAAPSMTPTPESVTQTSRLERLPPELIGAILSKLSSLGALRCALLSCRVLWNAFAESASVVATRVLFNELDAYDVRPESMASLRASRLGKPTLQSAHEFYKAYLQGRRNVAAGIRLTLNEVADCARLHAAVSSLATKFVQSRLQSLTCIAMTKDSHTSQPKPPEPSTCERRRIMRILYLLEFFFNLFRQTSMPDAELGQCMNDFFLNFASWEIEQIACVQEFLFFQVSPCKSTRRSNKFMHEIKIDIEEQVLIS